MANTSQGFVLHPKEFESNGETCSSCPFRGSEEESFILDEHVRYFLGDSTSLYPVSSQVDDAILKFGVEDRDWEQDREGDRSFDYPFGP